LRHHDADDLTSRVLVPSEELDAYLHTAWSCVPSRYPELRLVGFTQYLGLKSMDVRHTLLYLDNPSMYFPM